MPAYSGRGLQGKGQMQVNKKVISTSKALTGKADAVNARNRRMEGSRYEHIAGEWMSRMGYRILEYNFRCRSGEIDIVAADGDTLVFTEVKYRTGQRAGSPLEAVGPGKQRTICRCADVYRLIHGIPADTDCRFDVVGISGGKLTLVRNAFPYQSYR